MSYLSNMISAHRVWGNAQKPMLETKRWGNFPQYHQTLVEHNNSLPIVGMWVMSHLVDQNLDESLLYRFFSVHDHGEPLTGGDEHYDQKTNDKDLREWQAFEKLVADVRPLEFRLSLRRAFLLQYCRKDSRRMLPLEIQAAVFTLHKEKKFEAGVFDFTERIDYLFSAYEGYLHNIENAEETMIEHTIVRQVPKLDALVKEFPALGKIWKQMLRVELLELAK